MEYTVEVPLETKVEAYIADYRVAEELCIEQDLSECEMVSPYCLEICAEGLMTYFYGQ